MKPENPKKLKVVELFAGVGGFRLGLEKVGFEVVWSNQWEPSTKRQHANEVYEARFGSDNHSSQDIEQVISDSLEQIPDHDVLVGGFPCQDYSVASTLKNAQGLIGKKGVLWWSIHRILEGKHKKPSYLILENVDRLLKSPATQRGRDFAVMLKSLSEIGYALEWRIINAAEYGFAQRRRRIFMVGYFKDTPEYGFVESNSPREWLEKEGIFAQSFPIENLETLVEVDVDEGLVELSDNFNRHGKMSPFENAGLMISGSVFTAKAKASYTGEFKTLKSVLVDDKDVPSSFYVIEEDVQRWKYLKGRKSEERVASNGHTYKYSEGAMVFPDDLDKASRTIITGEGGSSPSRFKHVVRTKRGLRRLTPVELERLNGFPDNHTFIEGVSDTKRAFFMGNALVIGVIERIGKELRGRVVSASELGKVGTG